MANDYLKKIKELLEIVNNKAGKLETHVSLHSATMHVIKDQQSVINEKLDNINSDVDGVQKTLEQMQETLENHGAALVSIESRLDGFADAWRINRSEINKVKKHLGLPAISE